MVGEGHHVLPFPAVPFGGRPEQGVNGVLTEGREQPVTNLKRIQEYLTLSFHDSRDFVETKNQFYS